MDIRAKENGVAVQTAKLDENRNGVVLLKFFKEDQSVFA